MYRIKLKLSPLVSALFLWVNGWRRGLGEHCYVNPQTGEEYLKETALKICATQNQRHNEIVVAQRIQNRNQKDLSLSPAFIVIMLSMILSAGAAYYIYNGYAAYIFPPIGKANSEMLGQLGDYFGGFLNPTFNFFSIVLIMWSITFQRTEAQKNFLLMNTQLQQERLERKRVQISENMYHEIEYLKMLYADKFSEITVDYSEVIYEENVSYQFKFDTINSLCDSCNDLYGFPDEKIHELLENYDPYAKDPENPLFYRFAGKAFRAKEKISVIKSGLIEHIEACDVKSTNDKWFSKFYEVLNVCRCAGILSEDETAEILKPIQQARNSKYYEVYD